MYALTHIPDKIIPGFEQLPEVMYFRVFNFQDLHYLEMLENRLGQGLPARSTLVDFDGVDMWQGQFWLEYLENFGKFTVMNVPVNSNIISLRGGSVMSLYVEAILASKQHPNTSVFVIPGSDISAGEIVNLIQKLSNLNNDLFRDNIKFGIVVDDLKDLKHFVNSEIEDRIEFLFSNVPVNAGIKNLRLDKVLSEDLEVENVIGSYIHRNLIPNKDLIKANIKAFQKLVKGEEIGMQDFVGGA